MAEGNAARVREPGQLKLRAQEPSQSWKERERTVVVLLGVHAVLGVELDDVLDLAQLVDGVERGRIERVRGAEPDRAVLELDCGLRACESGSARLAEGGGGRWRARRCRGGTHAATTERDDAAAGKGQREDGGVAVELADLRPEGVWNESEVSDDGRLDEDGEGE